MTDFSGAFNVGPKSTPAFESTEKTKKSEPFKAEDFKGSETNLNQSPDAVIGKSLVKKSAAPSNDPEIRKGLLEEIGKRKGYWINPEEFQTNEQLRSVLSFLDMGLDVFLLEDKIKSSDEKALLQAEKRAKKLSELGVSSFFLSGTVLFTKDERFKDVQRIVEEDGSQGLDGFYSLDILDDEAYNTAKHLHFDLGVSLRNSGTLCNTEGMREGALDERLEKFYALKEEGLSAENACTIANMYDPEKPEKYELALKYLKEGMDVEDTYSLVNCDEEHRKKAYDFHKNHGHCIQDGVALTRFFETPKEAQNAINSCECAKPQAMELIRDYYGRNPQSFEIAAKFKRAGCTNEDIRNFFSAADSISCYDYEKTPEIAEKMYERFTSLLQSDELDIIDACRLAQFEGEEYESALEYFKTCGTSLGAEEYIQKTFRGTEEEKIEAREEIEKARARNNKLEEFLKQKGKDPKSLSPKDRYHIGEYCFESKFYTPEEYIQKFFELKNLRTKDGYRILNTEHLKGKAKEDYSELKRCFGDGVLYHNIDMALQIDPKSKEGRYFKDYLDLMQKGVINPSGVRELMSIENSDGTAAKTTISENLKRDIDLYKKAEKESLKSGKDFKTCLLDSFVPEFETENGASNLKTGDAYKIKGENFIRIKEKGGNSTPVKLSRETYLKLFPPVSRFSTSQQVLGDCYCIESMMMMFCDSKARSGFLSMMSENENGDITIKLPNSRRAVVYPGGKLPKEEDPELYSSGANGYKLFEHAYGCALEDDMIADSLKSLPKEKRADFEHFIKEHRTTKDGIYIYKTDGNYHKTTFKDAVSSGLYAVKDSPDYSHYSRFNQYLLANGSQESFVYEKAGRKDMEYYSSGVKGTGSETEIRMSKKDWKHKYADMPVGEPKSFEELFEDMKKPEFFDENSVHLGMESHAWGLTKEKDENGNEAYYLYNPHNQGLPVKFEKLEHLQNYLKENGAYTVLAVKATKY